MNDSRRRHMGKSTALKQVSYHGTVQRQIHCSITIPGTQSQQPKAAVRVDRCCSAPRKLPVHAGMWR
jgi:hypothetical protein